MVELREPLDTLISGPSRFNAGTGFPRAKEIRLYDTTLRDGEQTPGVAFTPEQKYELAGMLSDAGRAHHRHGVPVGGALRAARAGADPRGQAQGPASGRTSRSP